MNSLASKYLSILLLWILHLSIAGGASTALKGTYNKNSTLAKNKTVLHFRIDEEKRIAHFALVITDKGRIRSNFPSYLGLGIGETLSGSMLGADITTAEFRSGENNDDKCEVTDRHVPFEPFPLLESSDLTDGVFPQEDSCLKGDWTLVNCARDGENGVLVLEVSRPLDKGDEQDREIPPGEVQVLYAYGNRFVYHGSSRASTSVVLYGESPGVKDVPKDVDGEWAITNENYTIPDNETTYSCSGIVADVPKGKIRTIIGAGPLIEEKNAKYVHHLLVYICQNNQFFKKYQNRTQDCLLEEPLGNPAANCTGVAYVWAKGGEPFFFPLETGFEVNEDNKYLILEIHYDNPDRDSGVIDSSGAKLQYTDSKRDQPGSVMVIGDGLVSRVGQIVQNNFTYQSTCPKECTGLLEKPLTIWGSGNHMHTTGERIWTNQYDKEGNFIALRDGINFWSNNFQRFGLTKPWALQPGDQLSTSCIYDTRKRPETKWGAGTPNEMCMVFLWVYPLPKRKDTGNIVYTCGFFANEKLLGPNKTATTCSRPSTIAEGIIPIPNPSFEDTVGFNNTFGQRSTCRADAAPISPVPLANQTTPVPADAKETPAATSEPACFPATSTVELESGEVVSMVDLVIGDRVKVSSGKYSEVYFFSHHDPHAVSMVVQIHASSPDQKKQYRIEASRGHYIWTGRGLVPSEKLQIGDTVYNDAGVLLTVQKMKISKSFGLYSPHTMNGNILVDGIQASTYTNVLPLAVAHALLLPERLSYRLGFSLYSARRYTCRKKSMTSSRPVIVELAVHFLLLFKNTPLSLFGCV